MTGSTHRSISIALAAIALLIYLGHWHATFCSLAPAHWYLQTNPLRWALSSACMSIGGLYFVLFLFISPVLFPLGLLAVATIVCLIHFRPKKYAPSQLLLVLPLIPTFFFPIWAAYVVEHRPAECHQWGAFQNSWEMHVLAAAVWEALIPIAVVAVLVLVLPQWRQQRIFALSVLVLESTLLWAESAAASWPVANVWL
jgi:hypothetical protein